MKKSVILCVIVFTVLISSATTIRVSSSQSSRITTSGTVIFEPLASHMGGWMSEAVLVDGNYAYIGMGPELAILDVSAPDHPIRIGSLTFSDTNVLEDIEKIGMRVFVVGWGGLHIVDVTDLTHPVLLSTYSISGYGNALSVALSGNYAYIGYEDSFRVVDISNPNSPLEIGKYNDIMGVYGISVVGSYAYLALTASGTDYNGLAILDISNPASPALVSLPSPKLSALGLTISGNYAYMAQGGLRVFDISNPSHPTEVGFCDCAGGEAATSVTLDGSYAYISNNVNGLLVINISDPAHPIQAGSYDPSSSMYKFGVRDVIVVGNDAYLALSNPSGLEIVDISSPASPTKVGDYKVPGQSWDVVVADNLAYVADEVGLSLIDISNPENSAEVGRYDINGSAWGITVNGKYAYIAGGEGGLRIFDVSEPAHPTEIGRYDTPGSAQGVSVAGGYAYVADIWGGLRIIDVTTPITPTEAGFLDLGEGKAPWSVDVIGKYAYIGYTGNSWGLQIVDISDPSHPSTMGDFATTNPVLGVSVQGKYAYLAVYGGTSLQIIDISNPADPTFVGGGATPSYEAYSVDVSGKYAYVTDLDGISIFDVSNPAAPNRVGYLGTHGEAYGVDVAGNYVYVAGFNGLYILLSLQEMDTTSIAPAGGNLSSVEGDIEFIFPNGAFTKTANVTYKHLLVDENTDNLLGINQTFQLVAVYSDTERNAELVPGETFSITFNYTPTKLGSVIENTLALYYWDGSQWVRDPTSNLDMSNRIISAASNKITFWAVLGETRPIYLPTIFR